MRAHASVASATSGILLERDADLAALGSLVDSIERGAGALAIIEGQAGIGKTSLLAAVRSQAADRRLPICSARASEIESGFSYGVVNQLLEPVVLSLGPKERDRAFSGAAAPAARVLVGADADARMPEASFPILRALYRVVAELASDRPMLFLVDDLHWCDRPSLRFLTYLAKRVDDVAVGEMLTLRPAEPGAPEDLLDELRLDQGTVIVRPRPLSADAVATTVRATTRPDADEAFCRACHRSTAGNPLLLAELLRTLSQPGVEPSEGDVERVSELGSSAISRLVVRRLARLDPSAPALARAMAVLGDGNALRTAAALAGVDAATAGTVARSLTEIEILASEDPFSFVHPVVRQAIHAEMSAHERDEAHLEAARILDEDSAPVDQVVAHLMLVKPAGRDWCLEAIRAGGRDALARGAPDVAVTYLRRALAEAATGPDRLATLRELARAEEHSGDPVALDHINQAFAEASDHSTRADIAIELAHTYEAFSRGWEALDALWAVRDATDPDDADLLERIELAVLSAGILGGRRLDERFVEVLLRYMQNIPEGPGAQVALATGAVAMGTAGAADQAVAMAQRALDMGNLGRASWDALGAAIWMSVDCERFESARTFLDDALTELDALGHTRGLATIHGATGVMHHALGALAEAEAHARQALELVTRGSVGPGVTWSVAVLTEALVDQGELDAAERALATMPGGEWSLHIGFSRVIAARGRLRMAQRDYASALDDFLEVARRSSAEVFGVQLPSTNITYWRSSAALAVLRLGDRDRAQELADAELEEVERLGESLPLPRALGIAQRVAGLVHGREDGLELLRRSVETLSPTPAELEKARSLIELGAALRRANSRAAARDPLRRGLELALRCGAAPLAAQAREELAASGAKPRRDALTGRDSLTPAERRVAQLAAGDMTNREIAQALYVSVRTIEMHLARAYRKLDISSRRDLAEALDKAA